MIFTSRPEAGVHADERREHPRSPAQGQVKLIPGSGRTARGPALDVELIDRSMTGLRVRLNTDMPLSGDVVLLSSVTGQIYEARVVWRSHPHVGLQVRRTVDMRSANGPDAPALRKLWHETFRG
jgi:hypothetical protein